MKPNFTLNYSPNFSTPERSSNLVKFIIIHYTGMKSQSKAINRLTDVNSKVSCHFFIKKDGKIILMVPTNYIAWHAGKSKWKKINFLNKNSIGIEIQNPGHEYKYSSFNQKQILSLIKLCKFLKKKFKINKKNILGHSDISYIRKKDPGEKFPWELLAKNSLSIWHNLRTKELLKNRNKQISKIEIKSFFKNLKRLGYFTYTSAKYKKKLVLAFQRKFRNKLINGKIDKECFIISKKLNKN